MATTYLTCVQSTTLSTLSRVGGLALEGSVGSLHEAATPCRVDSDKNRQEPSDSSTMMQVGAAGGSCLAASEVRAPTLVLGPTGRPRAGAQRIAVHRGPHGPPCRVRSQCPFSERPWRRPPPRIERAAGLRRDGGGLIVSSLSEPGAAGGDPVPRGLGPAGPHSVGRATAAGKAATPPGMDAPAPRRALPSSGPGRAAGPEGGSAAGTRRATSSSPTTGRCSGRDRACSASRRICPSL